MGYGFTLATAADSLRLSLPIPESPQKRCVRDMISNGKPFKLQISAMQLKLSKSNAANSSFESTMNTFHLISGELPRELMDTLSLMVTNERELKAVFEDCRMSNVGRIQTQAEGQLLLALTTRFNDVSQSQAQLPKEPENIRQFHARQYTQGQLKLLSSHIRDLRERISGKLKPNKILQLEDVLSLTPEAFRSNIRSISRNVLRTCKAEKIQRLGYQDAIFTIFICLVWIYHSTEEHNSIHDHLGSIQTKYSSSWLVEASVYREWFKFLQKVYCPPPGFEGECHHTNCMCKSTGTESPWAMPYSKEELEEEEKVARSAFALIQRALLLQLIESPFAEERLWSLDFLTWGLRIWKAEGVSLSMPSEGDRGWEESIEQKALFLDCDSDEQVEGES